MNGTFIALNISSDGARFAEICQQNGNRVVRGLQTEDLYGASEEQIKDRIRKVIDQRMTATTRTLLVLSSEDLTYKDFTFPFSASKKVSDAIRFETSADYPPEEYLIASIETISGEPGKKAFLVAIVRRDTLKNRIKVAEEAGLKIIGITSDTSTLGNYFIDENECLVMEGGRGKTLFALYSHRLPVLVRGLAIGLKKVESSPGEFGKEALKPLVSEIKRTVLSFRARSKLDLEKIYLSGALVENKPIIHALSESHDLRFVEQPPVSQECTLQIEQTDPNAYAALIGAAGWKKKAKMFDFYKEEFAHPDELATGRTYLRWGVLALACFMCAILLSSWLKIFSLQAREKFLAAETRKVFSTSFPQVTRVVDEVRQARTLLEAKKSDSGAGNPHSAISILDILDSMSRIIPKDVSFQVVNLFWEKGRLEIDGRTDSFKRVNVIQELLSKSQDFPEVTISNAKTRSDGQDVDFKITIRLAS